MFRVDLFEHRQIPVGILPKRKEFPIGVLRLVYVAQDYVPASVSMHLIMPKRDRRVHARGATGGEVTGHQSDESGEHGDGRISYRSVGLTPKSIVVRRREAANAPARPTAKPMIASHTPCKSQSW